MRSKISDYSDLSDTDIKKLLTTLAKEQLRLRFLKVQKQVKDMSTYKKNKRLIALLRTIQNNKEKSKIEKKNV